MAPMPALPPAEIGSDFELADPRQLVPDSSQPLQSLPWEDSADIIYVESGRQALALAESELHGRGHTLIHVPSYLCDSMLEPFHRQGWTLAELPVDHDLVVRPAELLARVSGGVLLHAPYFGRQDSPAMIEALATLRRRGVVVIVDETHRVLSGPSPVADLRVASLRKILPLYDGGYVAGLPARTPRQPGQPRRPWPGWPGWPHPDPVPVPSESAVLRREAMRAKSAALASGDGSKTHLDLFARAERATETRTRPCPMSPDSWSLLHRLDLAMIRQARAQNSLWLTQALGHSHRFRVVNPPAEDLLPSHLLLETGEVAPLRECLSGQHVHCAIHWPASRVLRGTGGWPDRYLSLPIDQRYGEADMLRMAACVTTFFSES